MKRLLYYSDSHYTAKGPKSRKDNYRESIKSKLHQIDDIAKSFNADEILSGGDVTHHDSESYDIFMDLFEYHSKSFRKHKVVAGLTHDFRSDFDTGIHKSTLGALWKTGVVDVYPQTIDFELEGIKFHSSHQTICPNGFFGHHVKYEDLKTDADIVLISHLHMSFGITECNGKWFVSPGSVSRNSSDGYNINRIPQVALVEVDNGSITKMELIPLNVETDVFDERYLINKDKEQLSPQSFHNLEQMTPHDSTMDAESIIKEIGSKYSTEGTELAIGFKKKVEE